MNSVSKSKVASQKMNSAQSGKDVPKVIRVGVKPNSKHSREGAEGESPYNRIPVSEADSIFDEHNHIGANNEFVLKRNSNQDDDVDSEGNSRQK